MRYAALTALAGKAMLLRARRKEASMSKRATYRYHLMRGNKVIRSGITNDLERREAELRALYGETVHITQVGIQRTTEESARDREAGQPEDR